MRTVMVFHMFVRIVKIDSVIVKKKIYMPGTAGKKIDRLKP